VEEGQIMPVIERRLHAILPGPHEEGAPPGELGDLLLMVTIFAVAILPIASELAGVGRWGSGSLGLGTLGVLFTGRALCACLVARLRSGRGAQSRMTSSSPSEPRA
jgi:hypothetical protein